MAKVKKKNNLLLIIDFYKKYIFLYIGFLVIIVIKAIISFLGAMLLAKLITNLMNYNFYNVKKYALINLIIHLIYHIINPINTFFYKNLENNVRYDIQQKVLESSLNIKMQYYDSAGSGVILTRLTSDIDHLSERFKTLSQKVVSIVKRAIYLIYIFLLDYRLGFFVFISVLIVSLIYSIRIHYFEKLKPIVKSKREMVNSKIIETVRAIKDIKTLNCDDNIINTIGASQKEFIKIDNKEYYIGITLCNLTDIAIEISNFIFIILGCKLIMSNNIELAVFYTCFLYKDHIYSFINEFGDLRYKLAECKVCADRLVPLIYPDSKNMDNYGTKSIDDFKGNIEFKNVNFKYQNRLPVLKNVSFKIPSKKTYAIVGESGSGKTTIASLIGHLYYKTTGKIKLDDVEINSLSKEFIRENIVIVNQFPYLFNFSIRENFKMIKMDITDDEIIYLLDKVLLKDYVLSLPNKLDSIIGEGGCQLSGGQKQKLCIARSLARKAKIMIFDEATSSLDNNSQEEIMEIIRNLSREITIIIIAHRLSTITYADSIILLKNGKVEAVDTHKNLLSNNKYYQKLYKTNEAS